MKRDWSYVYLALLLVFFVPAFIICGVYFTKPPSPSPYDINQDGAIDSSDSKIIYDVFLDCYVATPDLINRCDLDHDGFVTDKDVSLLMQYILTHDSQGNPYPEAKP